MWRSRVLTSRAGRAGLGPAPGPNMSSARTTHWQCLAAPPSANLGPLSPTPCGRLPEPPTRMCPDEPLHPPRPLPLSRPRRGARHIARAAKESSALLARALELLPGLAEDLHDVAVQRPLRVVQGPLAVLVLRWSRLGGQPDACGRQLPRGSDPWARRPAGRAPEAGPRNRHGRARTRCQPRKLARGGAEPQAPEPAGPGFARAATLSSSSAAPQLARLAPRFVRVRAWQDRLRGQFRVHRVLDAARSARLGRTRATSGRGWPIHKSRCGAKIARDIATGARSRDRMRAQGLADPGPSWPK